MTGTPAWIARAPTAPPSLASGVTVSTAERATQIGADLLASVSAIDVATMQLLVAIRTPLLTKVMTSVTGLGSATAGLVFLGLFYLAGWRRELAVGVVAIAIVGLVVPALMALVRRPFPANPVCQTGDGGLAPHSFPSGHAAAVTVFALVSRGSEHLPFRIVTALAATVAVSRMYLGTHYLSDTLAGIVLGIAAFGVGRALAPRIRPLIPE